MNTLPTNTTRFIPVRGCKSALKSSSVRPDDDILWSNTNTNYFCSNNNYRPNIWLFVHTPKRHPIALLLPENGPDLIVLQSHDKYALYSWCISTHVFEGRLVCSQRLHLFKNTVNIILWYNIKPLLQFKTTVFLFYYSLKCNLFLWWQTKIFRNHTFQKSLLIIFNNHMLI